MSDPWIEINAASDPGASDLKRPPHPDSLSGEKVHWCSLSAEEQQHSQAKTDIKAKLAWHCKGLLKQGKKRENVVAIYWYWLNHFDLYLDLLSSYPQYQGARGKAVVTAYLRAQNEDRYIVFSQYIYAQAKHDYSASPGVRRATLASLINDMSAPMSLPA